MMKQAPFFEQRKGDKRRNSSGTRINQQIMMEQTLFLSKKRRDTKGDKKGDKRGTRRDQGIMMEQAPFLSKERRDKKGDTRRNQSRNQDEPGNHDGTKTVSSKN